MNFLAKSVMNIARTCIANTIQSSNLTTKFCRDSYSQGNILNVTRICVSTALQGLEQIRFGSSLMQMHKRGGPYRKPRVSKNPFDGAPFMKGVILKTVIRKPKKPNSANRKCVVVKLSNGKEMTAYVPGVGHNLQEHNIVLCKNARLRDTPGVKIKCVRGKYDLPHVSKRD
ncbi:PREDICTED: 40S ribosomal protein S12, mitochondrial isoform X2 [Trachymyrmex septentrionalis]|uniref:40S ribosomal protein S12, mitochondrial isoform X2 n=1 Tax=Trachymyrmex septentrionalis TaxID=34720 RepID=UPI00084ED4FD|nr:PREDICTED: 40S ribosomal protein S12, mitochondrial isoform X2 [Trachymyrmex septentrionalis]